MEAIILAGGKAERLGDAAAGRPKALVPIAGRPIAAHQIAWLAGAGVNRVILSCARDKERVFEEAIGDLGVEIACAAEPEPLGRGGGLKFAAQMRNENGPVLALNGDELLDVDLAALLAHHRTHAPAATVTLAPLESGFGVVDVGEDDYVSGFREAPRLPYWVNCGLYVLEDAAIQLLPERGDHEQSTFPELAAQRRLLGYRHSGVWLTINTPKDLRKAEEFVVAHPTWVRGDADAAISRPRPETTAR
ncbi:MAG: nucleotidyltransferase family protein [Actinomycetota bacterium]